MEKVNESCRDCIRDSNDPEITRRLYQVIIPEWLVPNVRLRLPHFLPHDMRVENTEQEYLVYFHAIHERMEVYTFVRRLFEEHNSIITYNERIRTMYIETAYLFCMDVAESTMSSNFFMYIPRSYYRRYLEDVPLFFATKACIIVDYNRRLAYRFGLCFGKMADEADMHSEDRSSQADSTTTDNRSTGDRGANVARRRIGGGGGEVQQEGKQLTMAEIMTINREIHNKRNESH